MKKQLLLLLFIAINGFLFSQTGPAGVGSSTNNVLWLKANAGTSTTTNGAATSSWNDQSGNGINVSQGTAVQRPTYVTSLMNGMPAIEFDNNNTAGQNDYLTAPDNVLLDNTNGYTAFNVVRMKGLSGGGQSIISKRTSIDTDEAFMFFFFSSNYLYLDIDGLGNRFSSTPTALSIATNYILDFSFDGTLGSNQSKIYNNQTLLKAANETSSTVPNKVSPLVIGATHASDNRAFNGYISEIILYRTILNDAQKIIVDNYLSAKYDITLSSNNKYLGDDAANGHYDFDVVGLGKESSGSNSEFAASVSKGLKIETNSGLDNGDYILAGHASTTNSQITSDVAGMTGTNNARWQRIWYLDITNTSTNINTDIEFDMSDGGIVGLTLGTAADYVLLYRAGQTGNWTEVAVASSTPGDRVKFNALDLTNDGYYTIGTKNWIVSPLPIELLSFNAIAKDRKVEITWTTASEINNDFYTIERTKDGLSFETVSTIDGAGNSTTLIDYFDTDYSPYEGISYYRLKQTDFNGTFSYSNLIPVNYYFGDDGFTVYPNPTTIEAQLTLDLTGLKDQEVLVVVRDVQGKEFYSKVNLISENNQLIALDLENRLVAGVYVVVASSSNKIYSQKLIVK